MIRGIEFHKFEVTQLNKCETSKKILGSGGIRTHASERLVPKTSALDHSATLPRCDAVRERFK